MLDSVFAFESFLLSNANQLPFQVIWCYIDRNWYIFKMVKITTHNFHRASSVMLHSGSSDFLVSDQVLQCHCQCSVFIVLRVILLFAEAGRRKGQGFTTKSQWISRLGVKCFCLKFHDTNSSIGWHLSWKQLGQLFPTKVTFIRDRGATNYFIFCQDRVSFEVDGEVVWDSFYIDKELGW